MKKTKVAALVLASLVLGLALGTVGVGIAAPSASVSGTSVAGAGIGVAMRDAGGRLIDVVAKLTGMTSDEVAAQRQDGTSFAQIAEGAGSTSADVVTQALKVREAALAQRVADGRLTQVRADAMLSRMETRLTARVSSTDDSCDGSGAGCTASGSGTRAMGSRAASGDCGGTGVCDGTGAGSGAGMRRGAGAGGACGGTCTGTGTK